MNNDSTESTNPYASPQAISTADLRSKRIVLVAGIPNTALTATLVADRWNYRVVRLRGSIDADIVWNGWFNCVLVDGNRLSPARCRHFALLDGYDFEFDLQTPYNTHGAVLHVKYGFVFGAEVRLTVDGMLLYCDRQQLG